jgi:hypothetical protein
MEGMAAEGRGCSFVRRLLVCEVAAVLVAGGYLGQSLSANNRLFMYFGWLDTAALLVLVASGGLAAAVLLHAAARMTRGCSDQWLVPWFYFLAVLVGFNLFPALRQSWVKQVPWLSGTVYYLMIWGLGGTLTMAGYMYPRLRRLAVVGWRGLAFLWPLLLIVPVNLMTAKKWEEVSGDPVRLGRRADDTGPPVVVIILDMVGYEDAFTAAGAVRDNLHNLGVFAQTAMVFHQARSCGGATVPSLPGLMLQEEVESPLLEKDKVRWKIQGESNAPAQTAEEFERALPYRFKKAGGRAVYIGYYLPYKELMPGAWDEVFSPCFYGVARTVPGTVWGTALLHHAVQYLIASKDPVAGVAKQFNLFIPLLDRYHRKIAWDVLEEGKRYIRQCLSPGDLVIIHLTVPHPPIVFDVDGRPSRFGREDPAGYADQLSYADRLFGELIDELKQAGQWDKSWVIMMSDHGSHFKDWSANPAAKRHVPFMVKAPGQTARQDLREPIRLADFEAIPGFPLASAKAGE